LQNRWLQQSALKRQEPDCLQQSVVGLLLPPVVSQSNVPRHFFLAPGVHIAPRLRPRFFFFFFLRGAGAWGCKERGQAPGRQTDAPPGPEVES
jgi:hypothetical protein